MPAPRFRFVDGGTSPSVGTQFWRDAEASERLGSRFKANLFLRELCRSKAWDGVASGCDPETCRTAEQRLLNEVFSRGFRLFGPDLDAAAMPFADAG